MLFATFLGLLLIPVFYVVVRQVLGDKLDEKPALGHDEPRGPPPQAATP
jgi:multidrug efflux pump